MSENGDFLGWTRVVMAGNGGGGVEGFGGTLVPGGRGISSCFLFFFLFFFFSCRLVLSRLVLTVLVLCLRDKPANAPS